MSTKPQPRIAIFCRCGAQWFGASAAPSPIHASHYKHCGEPIPVQLFELLGLRINWPGHWTDEERAAVRRWSLQLYGKTPARVAETDP